MKIKNKAPKIFIAALFVTSLACYVSSCKKDAASTSTATTVTETDAVELTTDAVVPSSGGLSNQASSSVDIYNKSKAKLTCGVAKDSTFSLVSAASASLAYDYAFNWNYVLTCDGLLPSQLTYNFTGTGSYAGPRMSSNDKSTGGFVMTGFGASTSQYLVSATYNRTGSTTSKILRQLTFTSDLTIKSSNIAVDKTTEEIVSGTATVTLTGTSSAGKTFSFAGTLTFLGNKKATLVLNSGVSYPIQWT
jgi:hypothetical protein